MIEWSEEHQAIRDAIRRFVEAEIAPNLEELEHGETPPYEVLRKFVQTFGIAELQRSRAQARIDREQRMARGEAPPKRERSEPNDGGDGAAVTLIPVIELSRYCPGMVTAMGVSMGLAAGAILSNLREETGASVVAIKRDDGETVFNPGPDSVLSAGDTLVFVGPAGVWSRLDNIH